MEQNQQEKRTEVLVVATPLAYGYKTAFHQSNNRFLSKEQNLKVLQDKHGSMFKVVVKESVK